MNTTLEYSTRVVQEGDRRCKKSTLNDLAYLTPLRIPLMNPVNGSTFICTVLKAAQLATILTRFTLIEYLVYFFQRWSLPIEFRYFNSYGTRKLKLLYGTSDIPYIAMGHPNDFFRECPRPYLLNTGITAFRRVLRPNPKSLTGG
jgi:hypothetical protein